MSDKPPTARQRKLADGVLAGLPRAKAAEKAGYSPRSAGSLATQTLKEPQVAAYLSERQAEIAERNDITIDELVRRLDKDSRECKEPHARIRATELLGKHLGMFPRDGGTLNIIIHARQQQLVALLDKALTPEQAAARLDALIAAKGSPPQIQGPEHG